MILLPDYQGKQVAVFGLGKTGASAVGALAASGARVFAWDDAVSVLQSKKHLPAEYIHPSEYDWSQISGVVVSPGVFLRGDAHHWVVEMARSHGCPILSDIEMLCRSQKSRFIGVTGTNGKSTTVELIGWILKQVGVDVCVGGNIGRCALSLPPNKAVYVLELSSYQIGMLSNIDLEIGVLLNISMNHLDVYQTMEEYIAAKVRMLDFSALSVVNYDNEITNCTFRRLPGKKVAFSCTRKLETGVSVLDGMIYSGNESLAVGELRIDKNSNLENLAAAYAVAKYFGIASDVIMKSIRCFPGLKHRNQVVGRVANVTFVNDSKATNSEATARALAHRSNVYWIVGGRSQDGGIVALSRLFKNVKKAFLIGESVDLFSEVVGQHEVGYMRCYELEVALNAAFCEALNDGTEAVILLSPACSSLDQWKSFEERGDRFCALVERLVCSFKSG